jgi:hypothetical protein
MKKIVIIATLIIIIISFAIVGNASWQEPTQVLTSIWGAAAGQIGISYGDSGDDFPRSFGVSASGNIVIADPINEALHIFDKKWHFFERHQKSHGMGRVAIFCFG